MVCSAPQGGGVLINLRGKAIAEYLQTVSSARRGNCYCRVCKKRRNYVYHPDQAPPREVFCVWCFNDPGWKVEKE